jgi:hypothetical protein
VIPITSARYIRNSFLLLMQVPSLLTYLTTNLLSAPLLTVHAQPSGSSSAVLRAQSIQSHCTQMPATSKPRRAAPRGAAWRRTRCKPWRRKVATHKQRRTLTRYVPICNLEHHLEHRHLAIHPRPPNRRHHHSPVAAQCQSAYSFPPNSSLRFAMHGEGAQRLDKQS